MSAAIQRPLPILDHDVNVLECACVSARAQERNPRALWPTCKNTSVLKTTRSSLKEEYLKGWRTR